MHESAVVRPAAAEGGWPSQGFAMVPGVLSREACGRVLSGLSRSASLSGGTRGLLARPWCAALAARLSGHPVLRDLIGPGAVAVQCTYFEKSAARNWLVPMHQDKSIPVGEKVDHPALTGWSEKEGMCFVQAPLQVLQDMVAVRVHLDDCRAEDGPLRVVPGSHRWGFLDDGQVADARRRHGEVCCEAAQGAALVMRPLLLHASSKATGAGRRLLLHFLFGPARLSHGLRWAR